MLDNGVTMLQPCALVFLSVHCLKNKYSTFQGSTHFCNICYGGAEANEPHVIILHDKIIAHFHTGAALQIMKS